VNKYNPPGYPKTLKLTFTAHVPVFDFGKKGHCHLSGT
jgi:hypothetical protein